MIFRVFGDFFTSELKTDVTTKFQVATNNFIERTVRKPVGRVFFAGEHTCSGVIEGFDIGKSFNFLDIHHFNI